MSYFEKLCLMAGIFIGMMLGIVLSAVAMRLTEFSFNTYAAPQGPIGGNAAATLSPGLTPAEAAPYAS